MEVTHRDDHVTHAVIGGTEKIDYGVADTGFLMQMLSSSLYKDQLMAVAREVLCNADDAHKENGITIPFEVTLTNQKFVIRDFGPGIPHDKIGEIYGTYGGSTKRNSDKATGGFGLGCKSPFAYTDNFQVTSYNNGVKTIYRMSKSDSEVDGKPSIIKIVSVPTQETGLEVSINITNPHDAHRLTQRVVRVLANGEMNAMLNGVKAKVVPFSLMEQGYLLTNEKPLLNDYKILVRYGAVIYPVDDHDSYSTLYRQVRKVVNNIDGHDYRDGEFCLILQAEPGSLSLTPSRETLTITGKTTETVTKLLENFLLKFKREYRAVATNIYMDAVDKASAANDVRTLLASPGERGIAKHYVPMPKDAEGEHYYITNANTLARWDVHREYFGQRDPQFRRTDLLKRINHFIKSPDSPLDRGLLRGLKKALINAVYKSEREAVEAYRRKLVYPVLAKMRGTNFMDKYNLHVMVPYNNWGDEGSRHYRNDRVVIRHAHTFVPSHTENFFWMMRRMIVLTHDEQEAEDGIRHNSDKFPVIKQKHGFKGALVYRVGRAKAKVEEARAFCKALKGFDFIDLTAEVEYKEPRRSASTGSERKKGYATLRGVFTPGDTIKHAYFDWQQITATHDRIEKPEAYAVLFGAKSDKRGQIIGCKNSEQAQAVMRHYGHRIAALINDGAIQKLSQTTPGVSQWLPQQIIKDLQDPALLAALPGTHDVFFKWLQGQDVDGDFVELLFETPELRDALKIPALVGLTAEQNKLMTLLKLFRNDYSDLAVSEVVQKIDNMQPDKRLVKVIEKLKSNPLLSLLDTDEVKGVFGAGISPELKTKALKLIKTVIKG